jgi:SPP1 family predicted phage head-tail adaptor
MRAGPMRTLVQVQRSQDVATDEGGYTKTWVTLYNAWCRIRGLRGREFFENANVSHEIVMRHNGDFILTPRDRLLRDSRVFNIQYVINDGERDKQLRIMALEEV